MRDYASVAYDGLSSFTRNKRLQDLLPRSPRSVAQAERMVLPKKNSSNADRRLCISLQWSRARLCERSRPIASVGVRSRRFGGEHSIDPSRSRPCSARVYVQLACIGSSRTVSVARAGIDHSRDGAYINRIVGLQSLCDDTVLPRSRTVTGRHSRYCVTRPDGAKFRDKCFFLSLSPLGSFRVFRLPRHHIIRLLDSRHNPSDRSAGLLRLADRTIARLRFRGTGEGREREERGK